MEKTIRQLTADLKANRAVEENLPELMNRMASAYGLLSFYNLDMELSMLAESEAEGRIRMDASAEEMKQVLYRMMKDTLQRPFDAAMYEQTTKELKELRDKVILNMDMLTAYTDLFILYEYVMNRLEAVFEPQTVGTMDNDMVAREILQWIFQSEDPATVNGRIRLMLSCLPVRMTKAKFLEHVDNAFSIYEKADNQSVDTFDYMLRCAAGLRAPKEGEASDEVLERIRMVFEAKSFSDLTEEEYRERKEAMEEGTAYIQNATECLSALQAIANALMTVLLTKQYFTLSAERQSERPLAIYRSIADGAEVRAEALFEGTEMDMEQLTAEVTALEPVLLYVKENLEKQTEELMLSTVYRRLLVVQRLNSGSAYATLEEEDTVQKEGHVKDVKEAFLTEVRVALEHGSRERNRAVMAEVLKELPVYFNNHTEVMNYVRNSLDACRDENEKLICVELLRSCYE